MLVGHNAQVVVEGGTGPGRSSPATSVKALHRAPCEHKRHAVESDMAHPAPPGTLRPKSLPDTVGRSRCTSNRARALWARRISGTVTGCVIHRESVLAVELHIQLPCAVRSQREVPPVSPPRGLRLWPAHPGAGSFIVGRSPRRRTLLPACGPRSVAPGPVCSGEAPHLLGFGRRGTTGGGVKIVRVVHPPARAGVRDTEVPEQPDAMGHRWCEPRGSRPRGTLMRRPCAR